MSSHRQPHISTDSFFHPSTASDPSLSPTTIYMISGNPGLIGYYHSFLSILTEKLNPPTAQQTPKTPPFQIYGHSLGGFELTKTPASKPKYYDLEEQICFVQQKLEDFLADVSGSSEQTQPPTNSLVPASRPKVILIGHSVGSYIAMEILRRHRERSMNGTTSSSVDFDIIGGVMLFPTVVDIAKSPSGQKLTLAVVVGVLVRILTALIPGGLLRALIRFYMGSPQDNMVDTTAAFLESDYGVQQALHMAADEMRTITSDRWSDDVWGMSAVKDPVTRLFFYFGRNDHWVAERTRDEVIELRGRTDGGPKMIVCEEGLPHAFVLKNSEAVAKKVADMVLDIVSD
ncbi:hypothetical protein BDV28DRAFT_160742 [Aspergillus coremiiformis]|uniref:Alpha/Beta hydrolase protein n=1 Tax=Aspergillus coremiiformis TaxID=138285 RepID=A0A5N6YUH4_9EURO|nr:hypothetical protein BDV28DRAFT_160742 [Aspergillus coremiiformis]